MPNKKQYKYPKNWFKNNIIAIPGGVTGNCSACIFREINFFRTVPKYRIREISYNIMKAAVLKSR